jgi:hypothetical protein
MKNKLFILFLFLLVSSVFSQHSRDAFLGNYIPPLNYDKLKEVKLITEIIPNCPTHWDKIIDIVSVRIIATCKGKTEEVVGTSNVLTVEQKNSLNTIDIGTRMTIKIKFKWKDTLSSIGENGKMIDMNEFRVAVVPNIEAEYPGGFEQAKSYLKENVFNKIVTLNDTKKKRLWLFVKFTVNEEGKIIEAKLSSEKENTDAEKVLDTCPKLARGKG